MRYALTVALLATPLLSGCASTLTAWKSRAFAAHGLDERRLVSMTGDRRLAFFIPADPNRQGSKPTYCMEALPDVATAFSSASKPNLALPKGLTVGNDESFSTSLTKTYDRSNETQFYRLISFDSCILHAMGVISESEYRDLMYNLTAAGIAYIQRTNPAKKEERETSGK